MKHVCGTCLFQGNSRSEKQGIEFHCLYDESWNKDSFGCDYWKEYIQLNISERIKLANDLKNSLELRRRHKEELEIAKDANKIARSAKNASWWAIGVAIASAIVSVIAILKRQ